MLPLLLPNGCLPAQRLSHSSFFAPCIRIPNSVDELHETATLSDATWEQLVASWSIAQILELIIIVGWYHLISFVANAAHVEHEPWAARFPKTGKGGE